MLSLILPVIAFALIPATQRVGRREFAHLLCRAGVASAVGSLPPAFASARTQAPLLAIRSAWDSGEGACALRPLVEAAAASPDARAAAAAASGSTAGWAGLWVARIEHFEKVRFAGLRVRPHYDLTADGNIVSHVHVALGPVKGWLSASGRMAPASSSSVKLVFDDFWVGGDSPSPRAAPQEDSASLVDAATRAIGRASFFEGLADFPVDYADLEDGLVAFRFTPLNSCIVAERQPAGSTPQRCV
mmetsp:Transcript_19999/g.60946  ORF Transcript_19999/g.60946 Transcript_19999/m.60946 type:complete len:245 (+) Transcript_19999:39-773(+)